MRPIKVADAEAAQITFGVEIETKLPAGTTIAIGNYQRGTPVHDAPKFQRNAWRAERDASIESSDDEVACEFVSPVLQGTAGLINLRDFIAWLHEAGATVDQSCGLHISIGVANPSSARATPLQSANTCAKLRTSLNGTQ